jgi:aminotransferase
MAILDDKNALLGDWDNKDTPGVIINLAPASHLSLSFSTIFRNRLASMGQINLEVREPLRAPLDGSLIELGAFSNFGTKFQICRNCVMDTTDPLIWFSDDGLCRYCLQFGTEGQLLGIPIGVEARHEDSLSTLRKSSTKRYDCIIGVSGGVDSSYLLAKAVEAGLRPLAVHVDAGWNSELAVGNIHKLVVSLGIDLVTEVIDWEIVRRLQVAFLASGVANLDTPQDHLFIAGLLRVARREKIGTILSGSNMATESILPKSWGYDAMDGKHVRAIYRSYWGRELSGVPVMSLFNYRYVSPLVGQLTIIKPLNEIPYSKARALNFLTKTFGWVDYGQKHYESIWTRYFQGALLPYRFGYDKRKAHLSSRIISGEISRIEAIHELSMPLYELKKLRDDEEFIAKKLELELDDFLALKEVPLAYFSDFPNDLEKLALIEKVAWDLKAKLRNLMRLSRGRA